MRAKLLVDNFIFFGLLKVVSAALPFFILPIITSYLQDPEDFAIYDNYTIIVSVLCSIAMMGASDAMFREFFIKNSYEHQCAVVKTGLTLVFGASLLTVTLAYIFRVSLTDMFFGDEKYIYLIGFVALSVPTQILSSMAISPSRMENNKKHIFYHTLMYAFLFYAISLLLLELDYGYMGLILGQLLAFAICFLVFASINIKYFLSGKFSKSIAKNLLLIGLPLVPIFIIYWANNAIVRIFIVDHLGNNEMGIFSLGSRYAAVSSLLQMAFAGGWSYFTYSTMNDNDQVAMKSKVFAYLTLLICVFYYAIGLVYEPLFDLFFEGDYKRASTVFSSLFFAPLLLILYQIVANQFTIIKKSYKSLMALSLGLIVNVGMAYYATADLKSIAYSAMSIPLGYLVTLTIIVIMGTQAKIFRINRTTVMTLGLLTGLFLLQNFTTDYVRLYSTIVIAVIFMVNRNLIKESIPVLMKALRLKKV